jgi:c-di-AMP phosphodiesterase-like protein
VYYYLAAIAVLVTALFFVRLEWAYVGAAIFLILLVYTIYKNIRMRAWTEDYLERMREDVSASQGGGYLTMPLPLLVVDEKGVILWYNSKMRDRLNREEQLVGTRLQSIFPGWNWEEIKKSEETFFTQRIRDTYYKVFHTVAEATSGKVYTFYWIDDTENVRLLQAYQDEKPMLAYIQVDNFDEVISEIDDARKPFLISEINTLIQKWSMRNSGILHRIDDDEFILLVEKHHLENIEMRRFTILDDVRKISTGTRLALTLSIGLSIDGDTLTQRDEASKSALELALGRGGDQAVIKQGGNYEFYGGRSKNVERKSRVKSRMVAQGLVALINESPHVYIMGHSYPDMDAFGACIGLYRATLELGIPASIVLGEVGDAIAMVYHEFGPNPDYHFIQPGEAKSRITPEDLLIIADTHRPNFTEAPELIPLTPRRVVIDHHRRGTEIVEDLSLLYQEPYASSTCEMVAEILQYLGTDVNITADEANALMAGIILDTKNFVFNTGVRTFDAAAYLRRKGANMQQVREFFQEELDDTIIKSTLVSSAVLVEPELALSSTDFPSVNIKKIVSQSADELVDIRGIETAFVMGPDTDGTIIISARSNGKVNVQVILEKLGGGGHLETAGAQLTGMSLEDAKEKLLQVIEERNG